MSTETPGGGRPTESLPVRGPAGGRVYGPGGAPMGPTPTREPRWLLPGAAGVGAAGVLLGVLLATGLTPFGPDGSGVLPPAPTPAGVGPSAASPTPAGAGGGPAPASAGPGPTGALRSQATSLCLVAVPGDNPDGAAVQQAPCAATPEQRWRLDGDAAAVTVVNAATGQCLDVSGGQSGDGVPVVLWRCEDAPHQRWRVEPAGDVLALISASTGKCLDVPGARAEAGLQMQQYGCNGTPAQRWSHGQ